MQRYIIWPAIVLAAAVVAFIAEPFFVAQKVPAGGPAGLAGQAAPVFDLSDDAGATVSLARYHGSIVVMNLWASWCPPCRAELPDLQRVADSYAAQGIVVVGVNEGESPQRAAAFAQSLGIRFPIWMDSDQRYGRTYGALGLPTTVVIGRGGVVIRGFDGALTQAQMRAMVADSLRRYRERVSR